MLDPSRAQEILSRCHAVGDFHALSSDVVDSLIAEADAVKYRKPKNAPGSRARMFHQFLCRRAASLTGHASEIVRGKNATVTVRRGRRSVTVSNP